MNKETLKAELSEELLLFLQQQGYSHILSIGADQTENGPDGGTDDYYLLPLTYNDNRIKLKETDDLINPIISQEVLTMAQGVDALRFLIEVPVALYDRYLNIQ